MSPLLSLLLALAGAPAAARAPADPGPSVVSLTVTHQAWEPGAPWQKAPPAQRQGQAVVVPGPDGPRLVTSASLLANATLVRVQKNGAPTEAVARVTTLDREANLAVLAVDDGAFFADLAPVRFVRKPVTEGEITLARWRGSQLETADARVARATVVDSMTGVLDLLSLRVATDMANGGAAEAAFRGRDFVGLAVGQLNPELAVLPADTISRWLSSLDAGEARPWAGTLGLGQQAIRSPVFVDWLGLDAPRGVLITGVPQGSAACGVLRRGDVLLSVAGQPLDGEGNIRDPDFGLLYFEVLLARYRAGDVLPVEVLREGKVLAVSMPLRALSGAHGLIPTDRPEPPGYLVAGGFVFRELDETTPARSNEARIVSALQRSAQSADRRRVILLAGVLADTYNLGYHGLSDLVVDSVNGQPVDALEDVKAALEAPEGGFHVVRFRPNVRMAEAVLDASTFAEASARIAAAYGITETWRAPAPPPDLGPACAAPPAP